MANNLARRVVRQALRMREQCGAQITEPVCPFDIARGERIHVRFMAVPSLEGLYTPGPPPTIIVGSERPTGRRNWTAAHEIGHHVFGHGQRVDQIADCNDKMPREEWIANRFAAALLLPKLCVAAAFTRRKKEPAEALPEDFYLISKELGVGYSTLISQMNTTLNMIQDDQFKWLKRENPKSIRERLLNGETSSGLTVVDGHWWRRYVELEVGDMLALKDGGVLPNNKQLEKHHDHLYKAIAPGQVELQLPDSQSPKIQIRISRRNYEGLDRWRYLEEPEEE